MLTLASSYTGSAPRWDGGGGWGAGRHGAAATTPLRVHEIARGGPMRKRRTRAETLMRRMLLPQGVRSLRTGGASVFGFRPLVMSRGAHTMPFKSWRRAGSVVALRTIPSIMSALDSGSALRIRLTIVLSSNSRSACAAQSHGLASKPGLRHGCREVRCHRTTRASLTLQTRRCVGRQCFSQSLPLMQSSPHSRRHATRCLFKFERWRERPRGQTGQLRDGLQDPGHAHKCCIRRLCWV